MKKIIRKLTTVIPAGMLAFSMVPATVQAAGMRIQVIQQDGQGYSWIGEHTGNNTAKGQDWVNAEYKKFNGKKEVVSKK